MALVLIGLGGVANHLWRDPVYHRQIAQKAEELREKIKEDKKFAWIGPGLVADVINGATVAVDTEGHPRVMMRLAGIDAPELAANRKETGQPLSEESRRYLAKLVNNQAVQISIAGVDSQKRPLVILVKDDNIYNVKMVEAGMAEAFEESLTLLPAKFKNAILNAEQQAKAGRLGIWGLTNYQRPFEYRMRHHISGSGASPHR